MENYIGIDISKSSVDVYDGKKSYKFENNKSGFNSIFELTGVYSYELTEFCSKNKIKIVLVGPRESRNFVQSLKVRSKTDKIDAKVLYKYQSQIRDMLYLPTLCAIQFNDRLLSNAKTKKSAVVASMKKLILMAFSLFKSRENYQPLLAKN